MTSEKQKNTEKERERERERERVIRDQLINERQRLRACQAINSHCPTARMYVFRTCPNPLSHSLYAATKTSQSTACPAMLHGLHCVSEKNDTHLACYNSDVQQPILIISGISVAGKLTMIYFPASTD